MSKCDPIVAQVFGNMLWTNLRDYKQTVSRSSVITDVSRRWNCLADIKRLLPEYNMTSDVVKMMMASIGTPSAFNRQMLPSVLSAIFPTAMVSTSQVKDGHTTLELVVLRLPSHVYDVLRLILYIGYSFGHKETLSASANPYLANAPAAKEFDKHTHIVVARVLNALAILNPSVWQELNEFYLGIRTDITLMHFYKSVFLTGSPSITEFETMQPSIYIDATTFSALGADSYGLLSRISTDLIKIKELSVKILNDLKAPLWSVITRNVKDAEIIRREQFMQQSTATISALEAVLNASIVVTDNGEVLRVNCDGEHNNLQITQQNPGELPQDYDRPIVTKMTILDTRGESREIVVLNDEVVQSLIMAIRDANFINNGVYRRPNSMAMNNYADLSEPTETEDQAEERIVMGTAVGTRSQRGDHMYTWTEITPGIAAWVPDGNTPAMTNNETREPIDVDRYLAAGDEYEDDDDDFNDDDFDDDDEPTYTANDAPVHPGARTIHNTEYGYFVIDASGNVVFHPNA